MSIQTNSEGLQRILQAVNDLPKGTQLPALSNPGTAADLASGKQLIDQNGNVITGTHQCPAGVTVKRYPASGLGTFTTNSSGTATVNCGFQPDVVYFRGDTVHADGMQIDYSTAIVFTEETRTNPAAYLNYEDATHAVLASKTSTGFSVDTVQFGYDWSVTVKSTTYNYVAIKYT